MKKLAIIINFIVIVPLLTIIFNVGGVRCEENQIKINPQRQARYVERSTVDENEDTIKDDKNIRFRMLELIIRLHLINEYQRIDEQELEDRLN